MIYLPEKYAYLVLCIPFILINLIILFYNTEHRKDQLRMGLIGAMFGPLSELFYFRDYWMPQSIYFFRIGSFPLMLEDVIFGFSVLGIVSVLFDVLFEHNRVEIDFPSKRKNIYVVFGVYLFFFAFLKMGGVNTIIATSFASMVSGALIIWYRRDLILNSFVSAFGFLLALFVSYFLCLHIIANSETILSGFWYISKNSILSLKYMGVPVTELVWAFTTGFFFGPMYKFVNHLGYNFVTNE